MKTKNCLCFPTITFKYKGKNRKHIIHAGNFPHLDDGDDWWDYWFTIGKYTYQLCGAYSCGKRLLDNLVIYVYNAKNHIDDSMRIDEIHEVTIDYHNAPR